MVRTILLALLCLAACTPSPALDGPPRTGDPAWVTNRELEPPNSLPRGFTTQNPFPPATGVIGRIRTP